MQISRLIFIATLIFSAQVQAFNPNQAKWPQGVTTMYLGDLTGNASSGASWRTAFIEAMSTWNNSSNFTFNLSHEIAPGNCANDTRNYVGFSDTLCGENFGSTTLAVTVSFVLDSAPDVLAKTDVIFNNSVSWNVYHGQVGQTTDFRRVAAHELGHALGLGHETTAQAIMAPFIGNIEAPTLDDLAGVSAIYGDPNHIPAIILRLETPGQGGVLTGISTFQGWVVSQVAIREVKLYVDTNFIADIPFGGSRPDVQNVHPQYPNSANAGFSMAYAYSAFTPGQHVALVRVTDINGNVREASANFTTFKFNNTSFFPDPNKVDLRGAWAQFPAVNELGYEMVLHNVRVDGRKHSVRLMWNTASQKFEISHIQKN